KSPRAASQRPSLHPHHAAIAGIRAGPAARVNGRSDGPRAISSAGRASRLHRGGRGFESLIAHQPPLSAVSWVAGGIRALRSISRTSCDDRSVAAVKRPARPLVASGELLDTPPAPR